MRPPARRPPIKPYDRGSDGPLKQVAILHLVPGLGLDRFRKALLPRFQNPEIEETGAAACRVERPHPELVFARSGTSGAHWFITRPISPLESPPRQRSHSSSSCSVVRDEFPGWEPVKLPEDTIMIDAVERGRQVGVQDPHSPGAGPAQCGVQGADRVGAAAAGAKPVGTGFEPGLPLGFQRVADPGLMTPIHDHWDAERALLSIGLRDVHASDR